MNVIESEYQTTIKEYLEDDNTVFVNYKKLTMENYRREYKNFMISHNILIYYGEYEKIGFINIAVFKDNPKIVMYMTDIYGYIYNMISYSNYIGCDIISVYLNDLINKSNMEGMQSIDEDYTLAVEWRE